VLHDLTSWLLDRSAPSVLVSIGVSVFVTTRFAHLVIRSMIRRLAKRSLVGSSSGRTQVGLWRVRARRVDGETGEVHEQRRRQRVDAASRMTSHLASLVIWIIALIVTFHLLDVDPAFFLSSAGFIGAALAIGGQHKVNDYLSGLSVHFEDRYGIGDEIVVEVGWAEPVRGVVDHVGLFSTRVRDARSTLHVPNHSLGTVRNLSQEAASTTLRVAPRVDVDAADAAEVLRGLAGTDGLTDLFFVGDLEARTAHDGVTEIDVVTSRALDDRYRDRVVERVERELDARSR
jgi:small conductance mechanosensitive channel